MILALIIATTYFAAESLETRGEQVIVQLIGIAAIGCYLS